MKLFLRALVLSAVFLVLGACGGGSSGTGTTRVFEGTILTTDNSPVAGATVKAASANEETSTDENGHFSLVTPAVSGNVKLDIITPTVATSVIVPSLSSDPSTVKLDITIDPGSAAASVTKFEVVAKVVGACAQYFDNNQLISQVSVTPPNLRCTVRVLVNEDGQPQADVPFAVQYRACDPRSSWITVRKSTTLGGEDAGVGQLAFNYHDDEAHCVYRFVTPYGVEGVTGVVQEIHTLTRQQYDGASAGR